MGQELHESSVTVLPEQRMPPPWDDAECAGVPLAASGDSSPVLARVAQAKPEEWTSLVGEAERGDVETQLKSAMEAAVLERPNGSFAQRVLAEFLKEMETRTFITEE